MVRSVVVVERDAARDVADISGDDFLPDPAAGGDSPHWPGWRRLITIAVAVGFVLLGVRSVVLARGGAADRLAAAADRAQIEVDRGAARALDERVGPLLSETTAAEAELAGARELVAQLDAQLADAGARNTELTALLETRRAELAQAAPALATGAAAIADFHACVEANQRALNLVSLGRGALAWQALVAASGPCGRISGSTT